MTQLTGKYKFFRRINGLIKLFVHIFSSFKKRIQVFILMFLFTFLFLNLKLTFTVAAGMVKTFKPKFTLYRDYRNSSSIQNKDSYWTSRVSPGMSFGLNSPRMLMNVDYEAGFTFYENRNDPSGISNSNSKVDTVHRLSAHWNQQLTRNITFEISDVFDRTENPILTQDEQIEEVLRERLIYNRNTGNATLSWMFGPEDHISLGYRNRYFDIESSSNVYGDNIGHEGFLQLDSWFNPKFGFGVLARVNRGEFKQQEESFGESSEDFYDYEGELTLNYRWHPSRRLFIKLNSLNKDFDEFNKNAGTIDFRVHKGLMGLSLNLGIHTELNMEGGYFVQDFSRDNQDDRKNEGSTFNTVLTTRKGKGFFILGGSGGFREDYFSSTNLGSSEFSRISGDASYEFTKSFRIHVFGGYNWDDYLSEDRKEEAWRAGTIFFFDLHRTLMLSIEVLHSERKTIKPASIDEVGRDTFIFIHLFWNHSITF